MRRSQPGATRGATLVEYALGVAMIAVPLTLIAVNLTDTGRTNLQAEATRAGRPDGVTYVIPPESGAGTPGGGGSGSGGGTGEVTAPTGSFQQGSPANKWLANYQVTIVNPSDGSPVAGAVLVIAWTPSNRGNGGESCTTDAAGLCLVTRDNISDDTTTVSASVASVNGTTVAPGASGPVTITCTSPAC